MGSLGVIELDLVPPTPPKPEKPKRLPMPRCDMGTRGEPLQLLANHFETIVSNPDGHFTQYNVSIMYQDGRPVKGKGIGRKVLNRFFETYASDLCPKPFAYDGEKSLPFAYDGEKSLYTVGSLSLPKENLGAYAVNLGDSVKMTAVEEDASDRGNPKRPRRSCHSKTYKVEIGFATNIPMKDIANSEEAVRVLDIIVRQNAANKVCLVVRQSFFHDSHRNLISLGGGLSRRRDFHSSFKATQGGLSLNMDVSTTMIIKQVPVLGFLQENQEVTNPSHIDWAKAKQALKSLRIKASHLNEKFKIRGISEFPCNKQVFTLRKKNGDGEWHDTEMTVHEYFLQQHRLKLPISAELPCVDVGKPKRPIYFPIELCWLVSLQHYTKELSILQRSKLVEAPRQRMKVLSDNLRSSKHEADKMLSTCGVSIRTNFAEVHARVLPPPTLLVGNGQEFSPQKGRWNFKSKRLVNPVNIKHWAIVNFSVACKTQKLCDDLIRCAAEIGMDIKTPLGHFEEKSQDRHALPIERVGNMYNRLWKTLSDPRPQFLLCLLPERKASPLYGPWKKLSLANIGIVTQCMSLPKKLNDQYLTNLLLKINAKYWGMNSALAGQSRDLIPRVTKTPTLILGMNVSHGLPGYSDVPSIAAVVSSRSWPCLSQYGARVRVQSSKVEVNQMIDSLFEKVSDTDDKGIIKELLVGFYESSGKRRPEHIIIFRDGVCDSQFTQVLNIELEQIIEACKFLDEKWDPKFTLIIAQKKHHTRFFLPNSPENVPAGTVIDTKICHPANNDFYICSHVGSIGTTRPTHYHVLQDEIGFSADEMQELVHSLSHVYQRSTTAVSVVAPILYAHHAASQMSQCWKHEDMSQGFSGHGGVTSSVHELPQLHEKVANSMFFC